MGSEHTKEKVELLRADKNKMESKLDRMKEYLEKLKDDLAEQRIKNLKNKIPEADKAIDLKDTHVDLSMEMFITHNKTNLCPNLLFYREALLCRALRPGQVPYILLWGHQR